MTPRVTLSEDGYTISGLEPPGLAPQARKLFWSWVVEYGLREKDRDLAKGLDKDGRPFRPISEETRKNRRSAMTPSGRGDPNAPPLIPGWQKSRTRSLLKGKAFADRAEFWWAFDPHTGDSWARILEAQKAQGRDVFGLGPEALRRVQRAAWKRWEAYKVGRFAPEPETELAPVKPIRVGRYDLTYSNLRGNRGPIQKGQHAGFMTIEAWQRYFRESASARLPGRPIRPKAMGSISGPRYNRLLQHIHQPRMVKVGK